MLRTDCDRGDHGRCRSYNNCPCWCHGSKDEQEQAWKDELELRRLEDLEMEEDW